MPQFMVVFDLPEPFPEEFIAQIPEQRLHIDKLVNEGLISTYSLSLDRTTLWCLVSAVTELKALDIIHGFPLIDFMPYEVHELMFTTNALDRLPAFSLN